MTTMRTSGTATFSTLEGLLQALGRVVPPSEISELWVFPPLAEVDASAEFLLFTRFRPDERLDLYSARLLPENGSPARQVVVEHGSVPPEKLPGLVGRFRRRLGEERDPVHVLIDGRSSLWEELLASHSNGGNGGSPPPGADSA